MKKNQQGFSLIELLIVVVIIGIIAAIAIPNLLASRRAANEGSTLASLRTLTASNATYQATTGAGKYAATMAALQTAGLIDSVFAGAVSDTTAKNGYFFTYAPDDAANARAYTVIVPPAKDTGVTATGTRAFFLNESGVIRFEKGDGVTAITPPTVASAPLN